MSNFIIFSDKRTGSSFLQECLNSHPNVQCWDEMFMVRGGLQKRRGQFLYRYMKNEKKMDINKYLDFIYDENPKLSTGYRLMYPQENYFKVLPFIKKRNIPIIHLKRKNTLKMVMSKRTKGIFEPKKMVFSPKSIINDIKNHKDKEKNYDNQLKKYKNVLTIHYENMIGRSEGDKNEVIKFGAFNLKSDQVTYLAEKISKRICKFIDVENKELFCNVTKKNSNNVWDYIKNEDEIKNALLKNGYEKMANS